jgi:DNA-binding Xre family transcriptional regulator
MCVKKKIVKSKLKEVLDKKGMDQKTLHKMSNVREATIGEMVRDENKTFSRDNLNGIINALEIKNINEILTIVEEDDNGKKKE